MEAAARFEGFEKTLNITHKTQVPIKNRACLLSPFFFILWNHTGDLGGMLNCSSSSCLLSNCWREEEDSTMTVRIPAFLPILLTVIKNREELVLYRQKRDFGITAAVVAIISACATAATVAGLALSQSSAAASTIDQLAERVSEGLQMQNTLNAQIHMGILNLNQQTALLQEQVDALWKMHDATCSHFSVPPVSPPYRCKMPLNSSGC
ncbi:uncharacterized protein LOC132541324 [Erinaceus europaeus]|uniref:Uncharacterized protein LOC132541324 n=1 Tax=Erinaceus europaeus TaxID=9365 RepID=A0ABM3Y8A6_ERIEU|nr:uncharacterized protein LOC132541324 [Erinaceus europaeus]